MKQALWHRKVILEFKNIILGCMMCFEFLSILFPNLLWPLSLSLGMYGSGVLVVISNLIS